MPESSTTAPSAEEARWLEVDRQLSEQRSKVDAFSSRSGMMIASSSLLVGVLASTTPLIGTVAASRQSIWAFAIAAGFGVILFCMARLTVGPAATELVQGVSRDTLLAAKIVALQANGNMLTRVEVVFFIQAAATVVGLVLTVVQLGSMQVET